MIIELAVENLAIIQNVHIHLGPGFTVLTGETGAGKSLLIDAVELALGERADTDLVRTGATKATVSMTVDLSARGDIREYCEENGIPVEDESLFIVREVYAEGKSQCRIAGKLVPLSALKALGSKLVDLHGQHDHQALLDNSKHLGFLDEWIGLEADQLVEQVAESYDALSDIRRQLAAITKDARDRELRLDMLQFQIQEIESAGVQFGEIKELDNSLGRLRNAERLMTGVDAALNLLSRAEGSANESTGEALKHLEDAARFDTSIDPIATALRSALYGLEEACREAVEYRDGLESDPEQLQLVADRIELLKKLARKYGDTEEEILETLHKNRLELDALTNSEENAEHLRHAEAAEQEKLTGLAAALTALRKQKAVEFSMLVVGQLHDLALERSQFSVEIAEKAIDRDGADKVEFYFTANAGELPKPLSRVASGGEVSRVMLAIKTASGGKAGVPTLIFDEVDSGLGGRVAAIVGTKIQELATHSQIVAISHLPQISGKANDHYRIDKVEKDGRVVTSVLRLQGEDRVAEVARMLAGNEVTQTSIANAREFLA